MIVLQNSVPEIYYNQSRDFQFLARSFEVLFNYLKTNADIIKGLPQSKNFDIKLLTLLAYTVGFVSKHDYNTDDLFNVCSCFALLLKNKGSLKSIKVAIETLLNAQQISQKYEIDDTGRVSGSKYDLIITLPYEIKDVVLLEDIFDYILPTGYTYTFKYVDSIEEEELPLSADAIATYGLYNSGTNLGSIAREEDAQPFDYDNVQNDLRQLNTGVVVEHENNQ